ncbi:hypothetical protein BPAE_0100g00050 [Botrytis paeoniae]|uniref:Calcineurin-like phosphoesterase domain-containing protein n=1 Tax=Botrytis paeoniae TaxID=278948 RepID=A0A4Z1FS47_9HELO|nr:hypothetical protein BPAE_0100g00050 [Botrytis paeoniae]
MTRMQKTSFILLSDTHDYQFGDNASSKLQLLVPKVEVLLHCGDLTQVGGIPAFKKALKMLNNFDAELKLVIAGNHDLELDEGWCKAHLEEDEDYLDDHARAMENPIPAGVHIVMTHGPPKGFRDENLGCENTLHAVQRVKPLIHCFSHIHEGYGANKIVWDDEEKAKDDLVNDYPQAIDLHIESGKETLMVNAATLDGEHQPSNAPWIINLDLPSS